MISWPNARYGGHQWALIQDNDPYHVSKEAIAWLTLRMQSWPKGLWPPPPPGPRTLGASSRECQQAAVQFGGDTREGYNGRLEVVNPEWLILVLW